MFCTKCGKELTGAEDFCANCGAPVSGAASQTPSEPVNAPEQKKPRKKHTGAVVTVVMVLLLIAAGVGAVVFTDIEDTPLIREFPGNVAGFARQLLSREPKTAAPAETVPLESVPVETVPLETEPAETKVPETTASEPEQPKAEEKDRCQELVDAGDLDGAISYLEAQDDTDAVRLEALRTQRNGKILEEADALTEQHRFRQAIALLDSAWEKYGEEPFRSAAADCRMAFGRYGGQTIAAGTYNTAMIRDGKLTVTGSDDFGELAADGWTDVAGACLGDRYILALHTDGTVSLAGQFTASLPAETPEWENIAAIAAGDAHVIGLTAEGSLVSLGYNRQGQAEVEKLMEAAQGRRIVSVAAGGVHTLALLEDGTVIAQGDGESGACNVEDWSGVASICAGSEYSAALLTDGSVRVTGRDADLFVPEGWENIEALAAGDYFLAGLKQDGTVVAAALTQNSLYASEGMLNVEALTGIAQIAAGYNHLIALGADGTVQCLGRYAAGGDGFVGMVPAYAVGDRASAARMMSAEKAYEIACGRWNDMDGQTSPVTGYELSIRQDGLVEDALGVQYYAFRLQWWVTEDEGSGHRATIDYLYVDAVTGDTSYSIVR